MKKQVSFWISEATQKELSELKKALETTSTAIMRDALKLYYQKIHRKP